MTYWERVLEGTSIPGFIMLAVGILLATQALKVSRLLFGEKGEKAILPIRLIGFLLLAVTAIMLLSAAFGW